MAMNNRLLLLPLLLLILTVAACRPESAVPTLVPTIEIATPESEDIPLDNQEPDLDQTDEQGSEVKTAEPSAETSAEQPDVSEEETESDNISDTITGDETGSQEEETKDNQSEPPEIGFDYADIELHWLAVSDGSGQDTLIVVDPSSYTLEFNADGTFVYRADCNQGSGTFELDGNQLTLDLGAVTLSECSGDSLADQYIQFLRDVDTFDSNINQLILNLAETTDQMIFNQEFSVGPEAAEPGITGIEWLWIAFADPADGLLPIDEPKNYTFALLPNSQVLIKADCNEAEGIYSLEESAITISIEVTTSEDCGADSSWELFVRHLNDAALYFMQEEDLFIDLIYDSGTMQFEHGEFLSG
jgi:heat shock protein HslJ